MIIIAKVIILQLKMITQILSEMFKQKIINNSIEYIIKMKIRKNKNLENIKEYKINNYFRKMMRFLLLKELKKDKAISYSTNDQHLSMEIEEMTLLVGTLKKYPK